jgi:hypothetical protein
MDLAAERLPHGAPSCHAPLLLVLPLALARCAAGLAPVLLGGGRRRLNEIHWISASESEYL